MVACLLVVRAVVCCLPFGFSFLVVVVVLLPYRGCVRPLNHLQELVAGVVLLFFTNNYCTRVVLHVMHDILS